MNEHVIINKTHVTPASDQERAWHEYFRYAFTPEQATILSRTLFGCSAEWRKEWEESALDAATTLQDAMHEMFFKDIWKDIAKHHDAFLELRAKLDVLLLALNHKTIDGSVVEIPKFIDGKVVQKKAPERDVIVDRIADIEKLAARIEKQIKDILHRLSTDKSHLVAQAQVQNLSKRVDAQAKRISEAETSLKEIVDYVRAR